VTSRTRSRARRLAAAGALTLAGAWALVAAVPRPLLVNRAGMSQAVTARDGSLLRLSLAGDDALRLWTPLAEIPAPVVEATLLQEDRWFYWHPGVNPVSLARAAWRTYAAGDRRQEAPRSRCSSRGCASISTRARRAGSWCRRCARSSSSCSIRRTSCSRRI